MANPIAVLDREEFCKQQDEFVQPTFNLGFGCGSWCRRCQSSGDKSTYILWYDKLMEGADSSSSEQDMLDFSPMWIRFCKTTQIPEPADRPSRNYRALSTSGKQVSQSFEESTFDTHAVSVTTRFICFTTRRMSNLIVNVSWVGSTRLPGSHNIQTGIPKIQPQRRLPNCPTFHQQPKLGAPGCRDVFRSWTY